MANKKDMEKNEMPRNEQGRGGALQALALTTAIGTELAITVLLGFFGGQYLDRLLGTAPWLLLAGVLAGIAVGVAGIYKTLMVFFRERK
ncbi:MAG: putative F0F1-ATPase [Pelotomaculum sp. PtaU1.Bin035]|nr:MAG: putative F0F1-ATPase [Pelotomaculum sp. PtaU1.Bin035]